MMNNNNMNLKKNDLGAIGIGAMIVFIALILVAAVASAVIIQTGEKLQQNAQQSGSDTQREISGKISVTSVIVYDGAQHFLLYFETSPGSDPITATNVIWQMSCEDGAAYAYVSDDFGDGTIGENQVVQKVDALGTPGTNGATEATLNPGIPYAIYLDANQANDCSADSVGTNGKITFWIHVEGGGSTFETLYISATDEGSVVI